MAKTLLTSLATGGPVVDVRCSHDRCEGKPSYRMAGKCNNCKTEPIIGVFTTGHEARNGWGSPECPVCGCSGQIYWECLEKAWAVTHG